MSLDYTDYIDFFLNSTAQVVKLDTLEIYHPSFLNGTDDGGMTYFIVRNAVKGITLTLEDVNGQPQKFFTYYPLKLIQKAKKEDLDYGLTIQIGDVGELLPTEIANVLSDTSNPLGGPGVRPIVKYRIFRHDPDTTTKLILGPMVFEIETINTTKDGSSFDAVAPRANVNAVGEFYTVERFPMLRGFIAT